MSSVRDNINKVNVYDATAQRGDILEGKTAYIAEGQGEISTGTMPNNGNWSAETHGQGSVTIPEGYHDGTGTVSGAQSYADGVTDARKGDALPSNVLQGKKFTNEINSNLTGTMPDRSGWTGDTVGPGIVPIPEGYHDGSGYVSGQGAYDAAKVGTARREDVLLGKTYTNSEDVGLVGAMPNNGAWTESVTPAYSQEKVVVIPGGYHDGSGKVIVREYSCSSNTLCSSSCYPDSLCSSYCYDDVLCGACLVVCGSDCGSTNNNCAQCDPNATGGCCCVQGCNNCSLNCGCPATTNDRCVSEPDPPTPVTGSPSCHPQLTSCNT